MFSVEEAGHMVKYDSALEILNDRNQSPYITYSARKLKVYPDTPKETADYIMKSGMIVLEQYDTELATVFVAGKG